MKSRSFSAGEAGFASFDLLLFYLLFVLLTGLGYGVYWMKVSQDCYAWLDRVVMNSPDLDPKPIYCFGYYWQEPPAEIDFGAGFRRNLDAPVLCFLEDLIPELHGGLQCE